jgi:hypothetical protein
MSEAKSPLIFFEYDVLSGLEFGALLDQNCTIIKPELALYVSSSLPPRAGNDTAHRSDATVRYIVCQKNKKTRK